MELIMENWRTFQSHNNLLKDREWLFEALGIDLPLNESYPFSSKVTELALNGYNELNEWWSPLDQLDEVDWRGAVRRAGRGIARATGADQAPDDLRNFWDRTKELGGGAVKLLKVLKNLMLVPGALRTYSKAIMRRGIGDLKKKIFHFLNPLFLFS